MKTLTQPDNIWVRLVKTKYLKCNSVTFSPYSASNAWKSLLNNRVFIRKGLKLTLRNEKILTSGIVIGWMNRRSLIKFCRILEELINSQTKVGDFIINTKTWSLFDLKDILPASILRKSNCFLFLLILKVGLIGNMQLMEFSVKTATVANNDSVAPQPKAKFVSSIWESNLTPKVKFFAWKPIHNLLLTRDKLKNLDIEIICDCPLCNKEVEIINHLFINCEFSYNIGPSLIIFLLLLLIWIIILLMVRKYMHL